MRPNSESGSVLIYVFIGVILFAALMFTFVRSQSTTQTVTTGDAKVLATEILAQSDTIAAAVSRLIQKGCSESELRFYKQGALDGFGNRTRLNNSVTAPQGNPDCMVFYPTGGRIMTPGLNAKMFVDLPDKNAGYWSALGQVNVHGLGSDDTANDCPGCELTIGVRGIREEICKSINASLGIPGIPAYSGTLSFATGFTGTFTSSATLGGSNTPDLDTKPAFCFKDSTYYIFLRTALQR